MIYLLDANIVLALDDAKCLEALALQRSVDVQLVEQVYDELCTPFDGDSAHRSSEKRRLAKVLEQGFPAPIEIIPGTHAERVMRHLLLPKRSKRAAKDKGEAASIAAAHADETLCFVTEDVGAMRLALSELYDTGERVQRLAPFARVLHRRGVLDRAEIARLSERTALAGNPPSWWEPWLASI